MSESKTPRTDALAIPATLLRYDETIVPADFARELERENAALKEQLAKEKAVYMKFAGGRFGGVLPPPSPKQLADVGRLREALSELKDTFNNGIQHDEERNMFYLVWTEKQIADAKARAEKLSKLFFEHEATKPTEQPQGEQK